MMSVDRNGDMREGLTKRSGEHNITTCKLLNFERTASVTSQSPTVTATATAPNHHKNKRILTILTNKL